MPLGIFPAPWPLPGLPHAPHPPVGLVGEKGAQLAWVCGSRGALEAEERSRGVETSTPSVLGSEG